MQIQGSMRRGPSIAMVAAALLAAACGEGQPRAIDGVTALKAPAELVAQLASGQSATVTVELVPGEALSEEDLSDSAVLALGEKNALLELRALGLDLIKQELIAGLPWKVEVVRDYPYLPLLSLTVTDLDALRQLAERAQVLWIHPTTANRSRLSEPVSLRRVDDGARMEHAEEEASGLLAAMLLSPLE